MTFAQRERREGADEAAKFLDAAREVLGEIDLDPASGTEANETVKAAKFYTEAGRRPRRGDVDCPRAAHARGTRKGRTGKGGPPISPR